MSAAAQHIATIREAELLAADAIGDVIEHWGFRKALGRTWTVLYLSGDVLPSAELCDRLQMSTGAVSMSLTELQRWGVVRRVWRPGERREFYEAETDFWKMISKVINERERFLAASVRERLEQAVSLVRSTNDTAEAREITERIKRLLAFSTIAETVLRTFVSSRLADFTEFGNLLTLKRAVGAARARSRT